MPRLHRGNVNEAVRQHNVKIRTYQIRRALRFVGADKRFPSLSQLASRALEEFVDKLEASEK